MQTYLRLVNSADRVKLANMAVVESAAVRMIAGLTAKAMPTRGPKDVPWQKAKVPRRP